MTSIIPEKNKIECHIHHKNNFKNPSNLVLTAKYLHFNFLGPQIEYLKVNQILPNE